MATPQPPADPNEQPANPYGGAALPDQPVQPYGAPTPYPAGPYPTYPPASMPVAPSQPMYPPQYAPQPYPPQYAPPAYPGQPPAAPSQPMYPPTYPPGYASSPSMPMYQQPPQPYPYGMQPGMPGMQPGMASTMKFALLGQPKQRGFLVAGIAAILTFLFFFIPGFYAISVSAFGITIPGLGVLPNLSGASFGAYAIWIWLVPLCALAAGGLAVWRAVSTQPNTATGLNRKNVAIAAAALGGVATLLLLIALFTAQGYCGAVLAPLASSIGSTSCGTVGGGFGITATISGGYGFSYWLLLLAAIGVGVGGIVQINTKP